MYMTVLSSTQFILTMLFFYALKNPKSPCARMLALEWSKYLMFARLIRWERFLQDEDVFVVNDFGNKMSAFSSEFRSLPMRWHLLRLLLLPFPFLSRFPPGSAFHIHGILMFQQLILVSVLPILCFSYLQLLITTLCYQCENCEALFQS